VNDVYGLPRISAQQVTQLLRQMKIDGDNRHCIYEKKLGRKYVTRLGLKALEEFIRNNTGEAIEAFGSREAKLNYVLGKMKSAHEKGTLQAFPGGASVFVDQASK
jgi:hypothetical protein